MVQGADVGNSQQIVGGGEALGQSAVGLCGYLPQSLGVGRRGSHSPTAQGGVDTPEIGMGDRLGGAGQVSRIPAFAAEGQAIHPQPRQHPYPGLGKMLGASRRPGEGKLQNQVRTARKGGFRPQIRVGHRRLPSLDEPPAHETDHQALVSRLLPHTGQQIGVAPVEGIQFTDYPRRVHKGLLST